MTEKLRFAGRLPQHAGSQPMLRTGQQNGPRRTRVIVLIPSGENWKARTSTAVSAIMTHSLNAGIDIGLVNLEGSMITKQRNDLAGAVRQHKGDFGLFVDADMVAPPDTLLRMLKANKDVVGCVYNKRVPPFETLGRLRNGTLESAMKGELVPCDWLPGGMVLIKAAVFEKLKWPWFYETYQWPGETGVESWKEMMRNNYSALPPEDVLKVIEGTPLAEWLNTVHAAEVKMAADRGGKWNYISEDVNFFRKLRKNGIEAFCDIGLSWELVHLGTLEVTCQKPSNEQIPTAAGGRRPPKIRLGLTPPAAA